MDRPHQKSSSVPLRKPQSEGKLFWLMVPGHFLWAGWFNCGCQGASLGARYWRTRLISSHFPVVLATRAQRARGQMNKGNSVCVLLSILPHLKKKKKRKKEGKAVEWAAKSEEMISKLIWCYVFSVKWGTFMDNVNGWGGVQAKMVEKKKWVRVCVCFCFAFYLQDRKEGSTVLVAIQIQVFSV